MVSSEDPLLNRDEVRRRLAEAMVLPKFVEFFVTLICSVYLKPTWLEYLHEEGSI